MKNPILKSLILFVALSFAGIATAATTPDLFATVVTAEPVKTEVAYDDLPEEVQEGFMASDYKDYTVTKVFQVEEDETITYEFYLENMEEAVIFDTEGAIVE